MTIDWAHFTPLSALAGGLLIGIAAAWLLLVDGRVLGASGLLGGLIPPQRSGDWSWRAMALAGLVVSPVAARFLFGTAPPAIESGVPVLIVAGCLTGLGTRLANGCTSGHGVCGLARLALRSFAAVAAFMAAGFATVLVTRHIL